MEKKLFHVEGMACEHCVHAVKTAVGALPGVGSVDVDLKAKTASVAYDPEKVTDEAIRKAIEDQGYDVV